MRTTILARRRDQAGQRTFGIARWQEAYWVVLMPRPGQLLPVERGLYPLYEQAWARLNQECGVEEI